MSELADKFIQRIKKKYLTVEETNTSLDLSSKYKKKDLVDLLKEEDTESNT
jgi:hypothetical protein